MRVILFRQRESVGQKLELIGKVFNLIGQTADELNRFFSSMMFIFVSAKTIEFIIYLYIISAYVLSVIKVSEDYFKFISIYCLMEVIFFGILTISADAPVIEVHSLHLL